MTPQAPPINPNANSFMYFQVKEALEDEIVGGKFLVGDRLPSIPELAEQYGVSISTIRRALRVLAWEGVVEVNQGRKGTVVAAPQRMFDITKDFIDQADQLGGRPHVEITATEWTDARADKAKELNLRKGAQVWEVSRIYSVDGFPMVLENAFFPPKVARRIMGSTSDLQYTYRLLREKLGQEELNVSVISRKSTSERVFSKILGAPALTSFQNFVLTISTNGTPVMGSHLLLRSDRYQACFQTVVIGLDKLT